MKITNKLPILQLSFLLSILSISGCSTNEVTHGYNFDQAQLGALEIGRTTNNQVVEKLGTPTSVSSFGDQTYYYIQTRYATSAMQKPKLLEQNVLALEFAKNGILKAVNHYDQNSFDELEIAKDETSISGNTLSPYKQVLSNVGKYRKNSKR